MDITNHLRHVNNIRDGGRIFTHDNGPEHMLRFTNAYDNDDD